MLRFKPGAIRNLFFVSVQGVCITATSFLSTPDFGFLFCVVWLVGRSELQVHTGRDTILNLCPMNVRPTLFEPPVHSAHAPGSTIMLNRRDTGEKKLAGGTVSGLVTAQSARSMDRSRRVMANNVV